MRAGQSHLFISGPTDVPETVRRAMNVPIRYMRAPDLGDLTSGLFEDLEGVLPTRTGPAMICRGSGTPPVSSPRRRAARL